MNSAQPNTKKSSVFRRVGSRKRTGHRAKELSVSIIGAGRLGTALGLALKRLGCRVAVVAAQGSASARRAAKVLGPGTLALSAVQLSKLSKTQPDRLNHSSLILIATPDDAIAIVAETLAAIFPSKPARLRNSEGAARARPVVLHTSGALGSDVLAPLRRAGFAVGSLHPLVSISESRSGADLLAHAFFSVEGDLAAVRLGRLIVRELGGESFVIDTRCKALYHAAALTASPNMTALFDIALEMLGSCGLRPKRAQQVLMPLVQSTVGNLATQDPARALTGTFKRGDVSTVKKHLAALEAANLREALAAYVALGQRSISMAKRGDAHPDRFDVIARLLSRAAKRSGGR